MAQTYRDPTFEEAARREAAAQRDAVRQAEKAKREAQMSAEEKAREKEREAEERVKAAETRAQMAKDIARQSDLILFIVAGDITRTEYKALTELRKTQKPLILKR